MQYPLSQMRQLTGYAVRLPARNVPAQRPKVAKCLVLVDVSGSVFNKGIQEAFTSILRAVPPTVADIIIFTFDGGKQEGPFKPKTYAPKVGGGGTEPWGFISVLLATPEYSPRAIDGYLMLTDGAFANPPEGLIKRPSDWCFVMTSSYTSDSVPKGAKIVETFVDDPEWQKHMATANSKDVMKRTVIKK
jgi:predicted metal-dependent peptidase